MFALAAVVFLSGCVAGEVKVDSNRKASVRKIAVHPMEPPPFVEPTHVYDSKPYKVLRVIGVLLGGGGGSGPVVDTQLWKSRVKEMESGRIWQPTYVVARQVEAHLKDRDLYDVQILLPVTKLYVGDKRGFYALLAKQAPQRRLLAADVGNPAPVRHAVRRYL